MRAKRENISMDVVVRKVKASHDMDVDGKDEHERWYDVVLGEVTFEKEVNESYRREANKKEVRACKAVEE
jgi:hypothetical protein